MKCNLRKEVFLQIVKSNSSNTQVLFVHCNAEKKLSCGMLFRICGNCTLKPTFSSDPATNKNAFQ